MLRNIVDWGSEIKRYPTSEVGLRKTRWMIRVLFLV